MILVGSEDPRCDERDWIPIYDRSSLSGYYLAIGTSGNQYKNGPAIGLVLSEFRTPHSILPLNPRPLGSSNPISGPDTPGKYDCCVDPQ